MCWKQNYKTLVLCDKYAKNFSFCFMHIASTKVFVIFCLVIYFSFLLFTLLFFFVVFALSTFFFFFSLFFFLLCFSSFFMFCSIFFYKHSHQSPMSLSRTHFHLNYAFFQLLSLRSTWHFSLFFCSTGSSVLYSTPSTHEW